MYRPQTIQMPDAGWGVRRDATRGGFTRALAREDLALDPQRVLMAGSIHDGMAAAIVDAEEEDKRDMVSERQDPRSWAVGRERRAFWDVAADYVHPPVENDVSVGPGAWTWPEPDIVPRTAAQDTGRRDASAPLWPVRMQMQMQMQMAMARPDGAACASCGSALRCACGPAYSLGPAPAPARASAPAYGACPRCGGTGVAGYLERMPPIPIRCACMAAPTPVPTHAPALPAPTLAQPWGVAATSDGMTRPEDDEATSFMVSHYAPGAPATTAGAMRASNAAAARSGRAAAGGFGRVATRAMRTGTPVDTEALVYGLGVPSGVPAYDTPYLAPAVLGVANRYGLTKMPGAINTTAELMRRDAAAHGIADPRAPLSRADAAPATDALGFRFADRSQFAYNVPKFFPARDPIDKLLYEKAAEVAPDMAADIADFAALRGMDNMIEPLSARYEMMKEVAKDMPHVRDPYMVPRTGPSVMRPGEMAEPPEWYVPPGSGSRARRW